MVKPAIRACALSGLLFFSASAAFAQSCTEEATLLAATSYEETLRALKSMNCLGTGEDPSTLVRRFEEMTPDVKTSIERLENLIRATRTLREFAEGKAESGVAEDQWELLATLLDNEELAMIPAVADIAGEDTLRPAGSILSANTWTLRDAEMPSAALPGFRLYAGLDEQCPPADDRNAINCGAYHDRKDMIRALVLAERLMTYSYRGELTAHAQEARLALSQWDSYFNEARFQWWWEVWANGRRMERSGLCAMDEDTQRRKGFCQVPTDQLIILHPEIALQYIDGAVSSDQLSPSFIVELFGKNSWSWDESGAMGGAFGWSIVASYTDLSGLDNWGFGGMVHLNNRYSFGVTSTDGEVGVFLSLDLSDRFFNRRQKYLAYLKEVEKRGLREMLFAE